MYLKCVAIVLKTISINIHHMGMQRFAGIRFSQPNESQSQNFRPSRRSMDRSFGPLQDARGGIPTRAMKSITENCIIIRWITRDKTVKSIKMRLRLRFC
jgi:hypothetical protein